MLHIKQSLARIAKAAPEGVLLSKPVGYPLAQPHPSPQPKGSLGGISSADLKKWHPYLDQYQRKAFQEFLRPLNMDNLKVYHDDPPPFDSELAHRNWTRQRTLSEKQQFLNYMDEKNRYEKMVSYLIEATPSYLKGIADQPGRVADALKQHEQNYPSRHYRSFGELPPIPENLTTESFQHWISILCRTTYYYRNSSSLMSGLVPDILLWTHHLDNDQFREFRSVHSYNELIYWFGRKNQSQFARQLLLIMCHDGHSPNTDTINQLLRVASSHARGRGTTSTISILNKNITFALQMGIPLNLESYTRVYDASTNIYHREYLLSEMSRAQIPFTPGILLRIVDDYARTINNTHELVKFIENNLGHSQWKQENALFNKVVGFCAMHQPQLLQLVLGGVSADAFTLKAIVDGLRSRQGPVASVMLHWYFKLSYTNMLSHPFIYTAIFEALAKEGSEIIPTSLIVAKGVLADMRSAFGIDNKTAMLVVGKHLWEISARAQALGTSLNMTDAEVVQWKRLQNHQLSPVQEPLADALSKVIDLVPGVAPRQKVAKQLYINRTRGLAARDRRRIRKSAMGYNAFVEEEMRSRGLLPSINT